MCCNKQGPKYMDTKYDIVERVPQFKYLRETIQETEFKQKRTELIAKKWKHHIGSRKMSTIKCAFPNIQNEVITV